MVNDTFMNFTNIPTCLTLFRVFMIPFFTIAFYLPVFWSPIVCTAIFLIASLTDWFDGFLARRWKQTTNLGKFLDPIADKIMIIMALILISEHFHIWWITLPSASIIIREIIISALREWISKIGNQDNNISVSWVGKVKTGTQMIALMALLCRINEFIIIVGVVSLYISVLLTLLSMCQYLYTARFYFLKNKFKSF